MTYSDQRKGIHSRPIGSLTQDELCACFAFSTPEFSPSETAKEAQQHSSRRNTTPGDLR